MLKTDLIDKVLVRMDEVSPFNLGLATLGERVNPIRGYVTDCIPTAWRSLVMRLPQSLLPVASRFTGVTINRDLSIDFSCDFIRLCSFKMVSWSREVTDFIGIDSPKWREQLNRYTRGSVYKPVVVRMNGISYRAFSAKGIGDELDYIRGVGAIRVDDTVDVPVDLEEPFFMEVAGCVFAILEQHKQAEVMFSLANQLAGI